MSRDLQQRRQRLDAVRSSFDPRGPIPDGLEPAVAASWQRCAPVLAPAHSPAITVEDVEDRWARSPIRHAAPEVVAELAALAVAEDHIAAVTDPTGHIIWSVAGPSMQRLAESVAFVRGADWREAAAGTNAPGLALATGRAATVFASEHWCESVQDWVCYAAPVRDPTGRVVGVLDLSARWRQATPLAMTAVTAMARLVEQQLATMPPDGGAELRLDVLGEPAVVVRGAAVRATLRQLEILTTLACRGPSSLAELHDLVYGERPVSDATLKAEVSHLRQLLGGGIESRPYRLSTTARVDAVDALDAARTGDLETATRLYRGQLLPLSESPFVTELRHHLDVVLRQELLRRGGAAELLRYADVHPFDVEVLERAAAVATPGDVRGTEARARLGS